MYLIRTFIFITVFSTICNSQFTWQWQVPFPQGHSLSAVTYGGGRFIAVSLWGTVVISDDGISWESHQIDYDNSLLSITWGKDRFIAVGFNWTTDKTVAIY
jgi:hypothetical protein